MPPALGSSELAVSEIVFTMWPSCVPQSTTYLQLGKSTSEFSVPLVMSHAGCDADPQ